MTFLFVVDLCQDEDSLQALKVGVLCSSANVVLCVCACVCMCVCVHVCVRVFACVWCMTVAL